MRIWEYCIRHLNSYLFGSPGQLLFCGFGLGCQVRELRCLYMWNDCKASCFISKNEPESHTVCLDVGMVHWLSEKSCKQSNLQSDELNTIQCSCGAGELKAGVEMLICERDPSSVPEHQPCNRRLPKIPLIFFECRRRVSSVEVLVWLRRWCWGCWFAMDGWGQEMLRCAFTFWNRGSFPF